MTAISRAALQCRVPGVRAPVQSGGCRRPGAAAPLLQSLCCTRVPDQWSCQSSRPLSQSGPHVSAPIALTAAAANVSGFAVVIHARHGVIRAHKLTHPRSHVISGAWAVTILVLRQAVAQWLRLIPSLSTSHQVPAALELSGASPSPCYRGAVAFLLADPGRYATMLCILHMLSSSA